ncbi:TPA: alpha/beta hydrolase, partial [Klebsiella pneumoniae]|nr:alpha/beta hydrolase [Klebsiella pneumoniae]
FETYLPSNCIVHHAAVTEGRTIHDVVQHLITLLPEKFSLIGFSMGGYIARQLAAEFPERVESLVLIASSLREDTPLEAEAKRKSVQSLSPTTFKGLSRHAIARSLHPLNTSNQDMISAIQKMGCSLGFEAFITQSSLSRQGIPSATIRCPTLVIASEDDAIRSMKEAEELVEAIPYASLRIILD